MYPILLVNYCYLSKLSCCFSCAILSACRIPCFKLVMCECFSLLSAQVIISCQDHMEEIEIETLQFTKNDYDAVVTSLSQSQRRIVSKVTDEFNKCDNNFIVKFGYV